jgi:pyruvate/2-oxoglutarate/acetoin dehydrogenase E1 component
LLDAPITRVNSLDIPLPVSRVLERETMVSDEKILRITTAVGKRIRP